MTIVTLPTRERRPSIVNAKPADIVKHPSTPEGFAHEAVERMKEEAKKNAERDEADFVMGTVHRDVEMALQKALIIAKAHKREMQAALIFEFALSRLKQSFGL